MKGIVTVTAIAHHLNCTTTRVKMLARAAGVVLVRVKHGWFHPLSDEAARKVLAEHARRARTRSI